MNYISNLGLEKVTGGWSGVNYQLYHNFSSKFDVRFVGPVNPPVDKAEKILSKAGRVAGVKGNFYFFSDKRLKAISKQVNGKCNPEAELDFYLGSTSWLQCKSNRPYACFLDASFPTYIGLYHNLGEFRKNDVERICRLERDWLNNADMVFYSSTWTKNDALEKLNMPDDADKHIVVKLGGNINGSREDSYDPEKNAINLLFISFHFEKKGGMDCWKAFQLLKRNFPEAKLHLIGQKPPDEVMNTPGVVHHGVLDKADPLQLKQYEEILSKATFLIHPTRMDATPTVLIEAAYFGCPSVAPAVFGIPDLIADEQTGVLLNEKFTAEDIAGVITGLLNKQDHYTAMRKACRAYAMNELSWDAVTNKMYLKIREKLQVAAQQV